MVKMTEQEQDNAKDFLRNFRDRQWAEFFTAALGLAALTHPEEVRKALSAVFDLAAIEDYNKRLMTVITETQRVANECRQEVRELWTQINQDVQELDAKISGLHERLDRAAKTLRDMVKRS